MRGSRRPAPRASLWTSGRRRATNRSQNNLVSRRRRRLRNSTTARVAPRFRSSRAIPRDAARAKAGRPRAASRAMAKAAAATARGSKRRAASDADATPSSGKKAKKNAKKSKSSAKKRSDGDAHGWRPLPVRLDFGSAFTRHLFVRVPSANAAEGATEGTALFVAAIPPRMDARASPRALRGKLWRGRGDVARDLGRRARRRGRPGALRVRERREEGARGERPRGRRARPARVAGADVDRPGEVGRTSSTRAAGERGAFYTLVPIRPRSRGERHSLRTLPGVSLRPPHGFNTRPRRLSTSTDAFQLHPNVRSYGTTLRRWGDG